MESLMEIFCGLLLESDILFNFDEKRHRVFSPRYWLAVMVLLATLAIAGLFGYLAIGMSLITVKKHDPFMGLLTVIPVACLLFLGYRICFYSRVLFSAMKNHFHSAKSKTDRK